MHADSWNFYHCNIDERAIKQIALVLKSSGLADLGYKFVNIDDCWQVARRWDISSNAESLPTKLPMLNHSSCTLLITFHSDSHSARLE